MGTRAVERIEEIDARSTVLARSTLAFVVVHLAVNADETGRTRTSVSMGAGHARSVVDARLAATGMFMSAGNLDKGPFKCYVTIFCWKFNTHRPPRIATNVEPYTFLKQYSRKSDTPHSVT